MDYLLNVKSKDSKSYTILLIGTPGVGKTAISKRYTKNLFDEQDIETDTVGQWKRIAYENNQEIIVELKDCDDEQENLLNMTRNTAYMNYDGYILCYSIENKRSYDQIRKFNSKLDELILNEKVPKLLIGNKSDLLNKRVISTSEGNSLATMLNCSFFECSAKTDTNINEIIRHMICEIDKSWNKRLFSLKKKDKMIQYFEIRKQAVYKWVYVIGILHFVRVNHVIFS